MYISTQVPKTLVELKMMQFSASVRSSPDWRTKLQDIEATTSKWRSQAAQQGLPDSVISYALAELQLLAQLSDHPINMSSVDGVWAAYPGHIPPPLRQHLVAYINQRFRSVPNHMKDWRPWSDNLVLDFVHPSLHCFVGGVTRVTDSSIALESSLNSIGAGRVVTSDTTPTYQWLPGEFRINEDGKITPLSYINNLHPHKHRALYDILCAILERFLPLLSLVLQTVFLCNPRMVPDYEWYVEEEFNGDEDDDNAYLEWLRKRTLKPVEFPVFDPSLLPDKQDFRNKTLQVMVKPASIELTPETPTYPGGTWHIEGTNAENVIATGIYYFHSENVTDSVLEFRHSVDGYFEYGENDWRGVELVYGLRNGDHLNQYIGSVATSEDFCICFRNDKQYRVQPFELLDKSKAGHCQILVFLFVDPEENVLSTAKVPPQQADWYMDVMRTLDGFSRLPEPVLENIINRSGNVMTNEEAVKYREELIKFRNFEQDEITNQCFERELMMV